MGAGAGEVGTRVVKDERCKVPCVYAQWEASLPATTS
jgi:hypothetical protein